MHVVDLVLHATDFPMHNNTKQPIFREIGAREGAVAGGMPVWVVVQTPIRVFLPVLVSCGWSESMELFNEYYAHFTHCITPEGHVGRHVGEMSGEC